MRVMLVVTHRLGLEVAICIFLLSILGAQEGISYAVLDLEGQGISQIEAVSLSGRLRAALVRTGAATIVERGQMEQILTEQDFTRAFSILHWLFHIMTRI